MVAAHESTGLEQAVSSRCEVSAAEVNTWKNELEFWRRSDTARQFVTEELERNLWKKLIQELLAKLLERVSKGVGNVIDELELPAVDKIFGCTRDFSVLSIIFPELIALSSLMLPFCDVSSRRSSSMISPVNRGISRGIFAFGLDTLDVGCASVEQDGRQIAKIRIKNIKPRERDRDEMELRSRSSCALRLRADTRESNSVECERRTHPRGRQSEALEVVSIA